MVADLLPFHAAASPQNDADLLRGRTEKSCADSGVPREWIEQRDLEVVKTQGDGRGGLIDWLIEWMERRCESCSQKLYESAHRYQDNLLTTIAQLL
ncbi:MAG: hypothetical protein ABIP88_04535 [Candidatus Binatia bacterium]